MAIDWITVSAQIVNFLILVWLLQRFLYQPVIRAMDEREGRIAERLDEARQREETAAAEADRYRGELGTLERRREEILADAWQEAEEQNRQLLADGREAAAAARAAWQRQVEQQKAEFLNDLRRRTGEAVQDISATVLRDLADTTLEGRIIDQFIDRLAALDEATRDLFMGRAEGRVRISSTFELDEAARDRLTRAVHERLTEGQAVEFAQTGDLICGIALDHGGRRLSWNVADYLDELTERMNAAFAQGPAAAPGRAAAVER